jgi:hypothetical protein
MAGLARGAAGWTYALGLAIAKRRMAAPSGAGFPKGVLKVRSSRFLGVCLGACLSAVVVAPAGAHVPAHAARVARLKARVAAIMPTAQAQVAGAAAQGPAALGALVQKVEAMPMAGPQTTTPQQYAMLQALQPYVTSSHADDSAPAVMNPARAPIAKASAASCRYTGGGHVWDRANYYVGPVKVGWVEEDHGYWCGNGYAITDLGGPGEDGFGYYHQQWSGLGYCQATVFHSQGWDAPHNQWAHGGRTTHLGNYTPWTSCVTFLGDHVIVRIAANLYWDRYWDF